MTSMHRWRAGLVIVGVWVGTILPSLGHAQAMTTNSAAFNGGYGRTAGAENRAVDPSMTDLNGNTVVINGLIQGGSSSSVFASAGGVASAYSGVGGSASASAIANNLTVVTQGDNNTVVVNSTQINTGAVTATSTSRNP